jgi:hypothetical protein
MSLAKRNVPIPKTQEWINSIFNDLKKHYDNTYKYMTRLDQIMLCVEAIEVENNLILITGKFSQLIKCSSNKLLWLDSIIERRIQRAMIVIRLSFFVSGMEFKKKKNCIYTQINNNLVFLILLCVNKLVDLIAANTLPERETK